MNEFEKWLVAKGFDPLTITPEQKKTLQAQWRAELNPPPPLPNPPPVPPPPAPAPAPAPGATSFSETLREIEANAERIRGIEERTRPVMEQNVRSPEKVRELRTMCESAIADKEVTVRDYELALLRANRFDGPLVITGGSATPPDDKVVEAALARYAGLPNREKVYDTRTLEAADKHFRGGLGLQDLLGLSARRNGWRGASVKASLETKDFWHAAFAGGEALDIRTGPSGPSTYSIPNIISNVANKFLFVGFQAVDPVWSRLCAKRSVNDFKQTTKVGLTGGLQYRQLAPGGEIRHDTIGERVYTNQANTYAIMLGLARTDLINDDTGALSTAGMRVGRGAALKINDIFWTVFLNNSSFFTSGNLNVSTGGGSALGTADGAAINAAEVKFMNQTDPDGKPLGVQPRILLAPPTLRNTAARWMGSQLFVGSTGLGDSNIFGGRYTVESSPYMENTSYTGNSTAAWYLLADPMDMPVIEGVALNGRWEPTVESADADFNQLGIQMRGYIDVGFALQEYRGGVRSAGS